MNVSRSTRFSNHAQGSLTEDPARDHRGSRQDVHGEVFKFGVTAATELLTP